MLLPEERGEPRQLRDYQAQAILDLRQALRDGYRRVICQQPTGAGKTVLAGNVIRMAREKGHSVLFTVPALDLVDQSLASFHAEGITDIGVIQANHRETDWSRPVQIASVQTLIRRRMPTAGLVIVDECHRVFDSFNKMLHASEVPWIGLSATPWTKGLGKHWDKLIVSTTIKDLIAQKHLVPFRVFAPSHPDLSGVKTVAGDYHEGQLSTAMNKDTLVADVVETWIKRAENRPTLVFGVDRAHAKHLQQRFEEAGITAGYQDAYTPPDERAEIKRRFKTGDFSVVCNVSTLTLGIDWPFTSCIVLARPTKSEILYVQIIGRGLRPASGKEDLLVLDHSDSTINLGFVSDIRHDHLDMGKERQKKPASIPMLKPCPQCSYLKPPRTNKCPSCGHEAQPPLPLQHADGELVELTPGRKVSERHIQLKGRNIPLEAFYGELMGYAQAHGYKQGWAFHKYLEATGKRPQRNIGPLPVSEEVASWIRSRQIAWAKRRRA